MLEGIERHRALRDRLASRVAAITEQAERACQDPQRSHKAANGASDSHNDASQVLAAQGQLNKLRTSASKDHLAIEAQLCQLCWRMQEQAATNRRIDSVIQRLSEEMDVAKTYLAILKAADRALYDQGLLSPEDSQGKNAGTGPSATYGGRIKAHLPFVLRVFEYYARQRWSVQTLEQTTTLGERLRVCKDRLAGLNETTEDKAEVQLRETLLEQVSTTELELLHNRFESRAAERTTDAMWNRISALTSAAELVANVNPSSAQTSVDYGEGGVIVSSGAMSHETLTSASTALSVGVLSKWLFSIDLCCVQKRKVLALLSAVATDVDPRDTAGNIAEVVFGASLDSSEVKQIYVSRSKQHIEEQWRIVALVVLFFTRLFRRAALQVRRVLLS